MRKRIKIKRMRKKLKEHLAGQLQEEVNVAIQPILEKYNKENMVDSADIYIKIKMVIDTKTLMFREGMEL